ncbi:GDSL lipase/esterase [Dillenia turbinata]|uniref:GDSL lipase/esterase n=1 Tax=Dillenia turbinata TaxID=194707 RepID=A0AAN8W1N6_9MAGN
MAFAKSRASLHVVVLSCLAFLLGRNSVCIAHELQNRFGKVKGLFAFGSAQADNGNNNFIQTLSKVNYTPYGIDFPLGPTGRFYIGKNVIDLLGDRLRLPLLPPFNDPATTKDKILAGVDYGSGASGRLNHTGMALAGNTTNLNQQVKNFIEVTLPDLEAQLGCSRNQLLPNYLFIFYTGGEDYLLDYFVRDPSGSIDTALQKFTDTLLNSLYGHIKSIYSMGGRKFVLFGIEPSGCLPVVLAAEPGGECKHIVNQAAQLLNDGLKKLVDRARFQLPASLLVFVNTNQILVDIINNPSSKGFGDARNPCCEVRGRGILCKVGGAVCRDRSAFVFFDGAHVTEAVNVVLADKAFSSIFAKSEVYPINVYQLALL